MKKYIVQFTTADGVNILDHPGPFFIADTSTDTVKESLDVVIYTNEATRNEPARISIRIGGQYSPAEHCAASMSSEGISTFERVFASKAKALLFLSERHTKQAMSLAQQAGGAA